MRLIGDHFRLIVLIGLFTQVLYCDAIESVLPFDGKPVHLSSEITHLGWHLTRFWAGLCYTGTDDECLKVCNQKIWPHVE